ncbi:MAG: hypothetical protein IJ064_05715 [Bacteroidaceae bacterium]|nr:hypothetical protein [Bacteroidaceae bacterium]
MQPKYKIGEVVAISQSYRDILEEEYLSPTKEDEVCRLVMAHHIGCTNKMFVRADLMPHHIQITGIRVERLQDISDEDCLAEGIFETELDRHIPGFGKTAFEFKQPLGKRTIFATPKDAYHALIDKIEGLQTWKRNPWEVVYEYKKYD